MRIAMVSEHASPLADPGGADCGGQNVHVRELATALGRAGHDVTVLTRRDAEATPETVRPWPGVRVRHVPAGPPAPLPRDELAEHVAELADGLVRAWVEDPPDVVHGHFWMSGWAAVAAAARVGVPMVQTFHALGGVKRRHQGTDDTSPPERERTERMITRRAGRVLASCTDERDELVRIGAPPGLLTVVPSGVDVDAFTPHGPGWEHPGRPRVVVIGRLVRRKGVDETIAAMTAVPDVELVVAGGPGDPADPDPELDRLRAAARGAGVADRVHFVGAVDRETVPDLLRSADVVVCAPWYEPFGIVPLEAMACGRPVVATAVGGLRDTVVHGETGVHVAPRRPAEIGRAIRSVLADPVRARAMGAAGRERAVRRYSWTRVAEQVSSVYDDVTAGRFASPRHDLVAAG